MAGITREHLRLIEYVEPQGVTYTRTKSGMLFRFPNGETEMIHFTQSDWRSMRNARANFRRNGIEWPGDARGKKPMKATVERVSAAVDALIERDEPVTGVAIQRELGTTAASNGGIFNALVSLGWWHEYRAPGSRHTLIWHPPLLDGTEVVEEVAAGADEETAEPEPESAERIFLDSVDSWTLDLDRVDPSVTLGALRSLYEAAGLHVEVRVWTPNRPKEGTDD